MKHLPDQATYFFNIPVKLFSNKNNESTGERGKHPTPVRKLFD